MSFAGYILFGVYWTLGPFAWCVVAYLVKVGRDRMTKLMRSCDPLPDRRPLVSVLVPAKDEGERIRDCLDDIAKQTYSAFEIIAINDRSTDDTGAILDAFTSSRADASGVGFRPDHVRVVHIDTLPDGWLGKCHALDQGTRHARGEWLFFVDSDVRLQPDALSRLLAASIARGYDALSILTTIETHTFVERLMLPLLAGTWMTAFAGDQTNEDSETQKALANGQVFLIRADAYRRVGGHEAVKDRIVEDVELMRLLKAQNFKCRFMAGRELAATRMHTHLAQMFNGWARIFAGTARGRVWPMVWTILFFVFCGLTVFPALAYAVATLSPVWLAASLTHAAMMLVIGGLVWHWSGNSPLYALLLPISVPMEIAILVYSVRKAISGKIDWRGSAVDVRQTSRAISPPPALSSDRT